MRLPVRLRSGLLLSLSTLLLSACAGGGGFVGVGAGGLGFTTAVGQDSPLRYENFNRIVPGQTRQEEILATYGQPMRVVRVASFDGPVWDYRFNDMNNPRIVSMHIDRAGVVQRVVYTDVDRRRPFGFD